MKASYRSYVPTNPVLRDEAGGEPCGRCGTPTTEKLLRKGKQDQSQIFIECPRCGWARPAAEVNP